MSDVLGTGAYGDPANPALTRQAYDELHGNADDEAPAEPPSDAAPAPGPSPATAPTPAADAPTEKNKS